MFSHEAKVAHEVGEEEKDIEEEEDFDEERIFEGGAGGGSVREGRTMTRRNMDRNIKRLRDLSISCVN